MSTTCKCVTTIKIFPSTYAVKTTRDIRFFTAFQGHDRNFHRITGTYIRGRETINRRQLTFYCMVFQHTWPLMLWWSCKYSCKKSKSHHICTSTKSMTKTCILFDTIFIGFTPDFISLANLTILTLQRA